MTDDQERVKYLGSEHQVEVETNYYLELLDADEDTWFRDGRHWDEDAFRKYHSSAWAAVDQLAALGQPARLVEVVTETRRDHSLFRISRKGEIVVD